MTTLFTPKRWKWLSILEIAPSKATQDIFFRYSCLNIVHREKLTPRILDALAKFNNDLKSMREAVSWKRKFTSYSLRHGFTSRLRNNKVDISISKDALGNETEEQTNVYLDDQPVADEINRALSFAGKKTTKKSKEEGSRFVLLKENFLVRRKKTIF